LNAARTALTGQSVGPGMFDVIVAIGQRRTVERLKDEARGRSWCEQFILTRAS